MAIATHRPKFRTDLVAQPLEVQGQRFVDVTDPDSEQTFRFYEVEYAIAAAMDGQRDVEGLIHWANDELGLESSQDELATVVATLADLGYLEKNGVGGASMELGSAGPASSANEAVPLPSGGDVELGVAGGQASERAPAVPSTADFELGSSGGAPRTASPEESFAGLMEDEELGPAGGPGDITSPSLELEDNRADTVSTRGGSEAEEDISLPPPPAPPAAVPEPTLTRSSTSGSVDDDDEDTQLPAPEPPAYDDDDVSVDLSDHLSLDANDVKEAVRASKVMQAVPMPDLAADIEDEATPPPGLEEEPPPIELSSARDEEPPLPAAPAVEPVPEPVAEKKSSMGALLLALLLVAAAGGGAYYYFVIMPQQNAAPAPPRPGATPTTTNTPSEPPPPAPAPKAALAEGPAESADVGAIANGRIEWILGSGEEVDEGAVVARLDGARRVEAARRRYEKRLEHYQGKLAGAQEAGDDRRTAAYQAKVAEKQGLVDAENERLAQLIMRAPQAGTVEPVVRGGASVKQGEPVVRIVGKKGFSATFDRGGEELSEGDPCKVTLADGSSAEGCEVLAVDGDIVTIGLPPTSGVSIGDQVTLDL